MTVATELAKSHGSIPVLYLAIDGLEPYLFQRSEYGVPSWSRSTKVCLIPPEERSMGLDLAEMKAELSAMTIGLLDIKESDGTSYFGKLFSTGRWATEPHARVTEGATYGVQIDANAVTIPIKSNADIPSSGTGYIGHETINWSSANTESLIGVQKGLYSSVDVSSPWGKSYARPPVGGIGYSYHVGTVPFSFVGRRVALYLTAYDLAIGGYRGANESVLVWCGRIDEQITQNGRTGAWELTCKSILQELDRNIPIEFPYTNLRNINLKGTKGRTFKIFFHIGNPYPEIIGNIVIPAGEYTPKELVSEINRIIFYDDVWVLSSGSVPFSLYKSASYNNTFTMLEIDNPTHGGFGKCAWFAQTGNSIAQAGVFIIQLGSYYETCHALGALGFDSRGKITIAADSLVSGAGTVYTGYLVAEEKYFKSYHPLHQEYNGSYLVCDEPLRMWSDQGDDSAITQAAVVVEGAQYAPYAKNLTVSEGNYFARYNARGSAGTYLLSLIADPIPPISEDGYVGAQYGEDPVIVTQCYLPAYEQNNKSKKGPFELLLTPLLSTGTPGYNGAYDRGPLDLGLGVQQELVDVQSFLRADKIVMSNMLAYRKMYPITEPESYIELLTRECKLFGYALVWRDGRLSLRPIIQPDAETYTVTLSDSTAIKPDEFPSPTQSTGTVVNQYKLELDYNMQTGKWGAPYIITDVDSVIGTTVTKQASVKTTGIYIKGMKTAAIKAALEALLIGRFIRYPLPTVDVTLAPNLVNKVFVGDVVKFTSTRIQDPFGTGTRVVSSYALIVNATWNYKTHAGTAKLLVLDWPVANAWSPAAVVDQDAAGSDAGYVAASNAIILDAHTWSNSAHPEDGTAVGVAGWKVVVLDRCPADPSSQTIHGPFTVLSYHASNHAMHLNEAIAGWLNTTGHIVTFADYGSINTDQATMGKGTWQADTNSERLSGNANPQRYR